MLQNTKKQNSYLNSNFPSQKHFDYMHIPVPYPSINNNTPSCSSNAFSPCFLSSPLIHEYENKNLTFSSYEPKDLPYTQNMLHDKESQFSLYAKDTLITRKGYKNEEKRDESYTAYKSPDLLRSSVHPDKGNDNYLHSPSGLGTSGDLSNFRARRSAVSCSSCSSCHSNDALTNIFKSVSSFVQGWYREEKNDTSSNILEAHQTKKAQRKKKEGSYCHRTSLSPSDLHTENTNYANQIHAKSSADTMKNLRCLSNCSSFKPVEVFKSNGRRNASQRSFQNIKREKDLNYKMSRLRFSKTSVMATPRNDQFKWKFWESHTKLLNDMVKETACVEKFQILKNIFYEYAISKNCYMSFKEFSLLLTKYDALDEQHHLFYFHALDRNQNSFLTVDEFRCGMLACSPHTSHDFHLSSGKLRMQYIFRLYDLDRDGELNKNEIKALLSHLHFLKKNTGKKRLFTDESLERESDELLQRYNNSFGYSSFFECVTKQIFTTTHKLFRSKRDLADAIKQHNALPKSVQNFESEKKNKEGCIKTKQEQKNKIIESNEVIKICKKITRKFFDNLEMSLNSFEVKLRNEAFDFVNSQEILLLCDRIVEIFCAEDSLVEANLPVKVYGDIHGHLFDLLDFFHLYGYPSFNVDKLDYQQNEESKNITSIFCGNYVDRGEFSLEVILLVFSLKILNSSKIVLLRGNHEDKYMNFSYGFHTEVIQKLGKEDGWLVWNRINDVFEFLPIACYVENDVLCLHGGIGDSIDTIDDLKQIKKPICLSFYRHGKKREEITVYERRVLDCLCSEPIKDAFISNQNKNFLNYSCKSLETLSAASFDTNSIKKFVEKNNLKLIVRSHECLEDGYEYSCEDKLLTIFSATNHCSQYNHSALVYIQRDTLTNKLIVHTQVLRCKKEENYVHSPSKYNTEQLKMENSVPSLSFVGGSSHDQSSSSRVYIPIPNEYIMYSAGYTPNEVEKRPNYFSSNSSPSGSTYLHSASLNNIYFAGCASPLEDNYNLSNNNCSNNNNIIHEKNKDVRSFYGEKDSVADGLVIRLSNIPKLPNSFDNNISANKLNFIAPKNEVSSGSSHASNHKDILCNFTASNKNYIMECPAVNASFNDFSRIGSSPSNCSLSDGFSSNSNFQRSGMSCAENNQRFVQYYVADMNSAPLYTNTCSLSPYYFPSNALPLPHSQVSAVIPQNIANVDNLMECKNSYSTYSAATNGTNGHAHDFFSNQNNKGVTYPTHLPLDCSKSSSDANYIHHSNAAIQNNSDSDANNKIINLKVVHQKNDTSPQGSPPHPENKCNEEPTAQTTKDCKQDKNDLVSDNDTSNFNIKSSILEEYGILSRRKVCSLPPEPLPQQKIKGRI